MIMRFGGSTPTGHFFFNVSGNSGISNAFEGQFFALSTVASGNVAEANRSTPSLRDGVITEFGMAGSNSTTAIATVTLRNDGTSLIFILNWPIGFDGTVVAVGQETVSVGNILSFIVVTINPAGNLNARGWGICGVYG